MAQWPCSGQNNYNNMNKIPTYALYGEAAQPVWHESLHVEQISKRSGAHNWEIAAHRHDGLLQLLYLQSGGGEVLFDSDRLQVQAPCVVYVPAQVVHGFHWSGQVEGQVITAAQHPLEGIAQVLAPSLGAQLRKPQVIALPRWPADEDPLLPLCRALREEYHNRAREHVASSMALLLTLVIQVLRHEPQLPQAELRPVSRRSQQLTAFRELVDMHYRVHWPLAQYAAELGMTPATLGRLCQEHLGMTPMNVINARLVLEAKRMLGHSSLNVKAIAHELGFADVGYFSRFFRKQAGVSPSGFREGQ